MKLRINLYQALVNRVPVIQKKYHKLRLEKPGTWGRMYAWAALLWMNLIWLFGYRSMQQEMLWPDSRKAIPKAPESMLSAHMSPSDLAERLALADIISFDIFDTLIFRPFSVPTDLFFFVGEKLHFMDFERIRRKAEWNVRKEAHECTGSYEVTLEQIYEELEYRTGISKAEGMKTEITTELEFCFANPYMKEVFSILREKVKDTKKKIICLSDMYLSADILCAMLKKCGYMNVECIFVSCEEHGSKAEGQLYKSVKELYGKNLKYIHIGDNPESDVSRAKESGWEAVLYRNVNIAGIPYRAEDMSVLTGSLYRGIVNSRIHNGLKNYSSDYELGYIYGGIFVVGYCQFIHDYISTHHIDNILFLSRDGQILEKVYRQLYQSDSKADSTDGSCGTEYVYWSRSVAVKLLAEYDRNDFLRRFVDHKINNGYYLKDVMDSMGLADMLADLCESTGLLPESYLTDKNAMMIKEYLLLHWQKVLLHYKDSRKAAGRYYGKVLENCHHVAAVDVGWAGSGALALDMLVKKIWKPDCDVTGIIAGTNTFYNAESNAAESFLHTGKLVSYLYSQEQNRAGWKWHNPGKDHNLLVEQLLSAKEGSLADIVPDASEEKGYRFVFKNPDTEPWRVEQIQQGIMDFAKDYQMYIPEHYYKTHRISGEDAYAVLKILLQSKVATKLEAGV